MSKKSHIDMDKLNDVPSAHPFEYRDVVMDDSPVEEHTEDEKKFKSEVENEFYGMVIREDDLDRIQYRKL